MIDRDARNRLAVLMRGYISDEFTAFHFDDALDAFRDSQDDAVRFVTDALWYFYDDCDDHFVVLAKPGWDYFQRLLLLIESDSAVTFRRSWRWSYSQLIAMAFLLLCVGIVTHFGFGFHLPIFFIPFGVGSIVLSRLRQKQETRSVQPFESILTPFKSINDLRVAYESTQFRKMRYPSRLKARTIRTPGMHWFGMAHSYVFWSLLAPIPLLFQCFPSRTNDVDIKPA